jgi:hypothetical protein
MDFGTMIPQNIGMTPRFIFEIKAHKIGFGKTICPVALRKDKHRPVSKAGGLRASYQRLVFTVEIGKMRPILRLRI